MNILMSALPKTWILDLDGTILKHNGYKIDGVDSFLPGYERILSQIEDADMVILVTSRKIEYKEITEKFLQDNNIRYDSIIYEAPYGERIVINDRKPSGLQMAYAYNPDRDRVGNLQVVRNENL